MSVRRVSFAPDVLEQAAEVLKAEGCTVQAPPLELLKHGIVLVARFPERDDGFLVEAAELGPIARLGSAYLDPYREETTPRWKREATPDASRMQRYAEAVLARACTEVVSAPEGIRNETLNRVAWVVGRYLGWGLDASQTEAELERAGVLAGLDEREANSTVKRALERGADNARDPSDLEPQHVPLKSRQLSRMRGWT